MHQRDLIKKAWAEAGLYESKDAKLLQFLKRVDESTMECWPELIELVRTQYRDYLETLLTPIWKTGDKVIRLNLLRATDFDRLDEKKLAEKVMRRLRPATDDLELRALIRVAPLDMIETAARRKNLRDDLRELIEMRRVQVASRPA